MNKVKKIENFVLSEHTNNLYKKEAGSSIALARDVANKVNELVEAFNNLNTYELEKVHEQDGKIAKAILYMKDNLLNTINSLLNLKGDEMMDNAVKEYLGTLKADLDLLETRLNNLLGSVTSGSTTLDSEVIDIRNGYDGVTYTNASESIHKQLNTFVHVDSSNYRNVLPDLNNATKPRYILNFALTDTNLPLNLPFETMPEQVVELEVVNRGLYATQKIITKGVIYTRFKGGSSWSKWVNGDSNKYIFIHKGNYESLLKDLNECDITKTYILNFASGSTTIPANLPFSSIPDTLLFLNTYSNGEYGYQELVPANNKYLYRRMYAMGWKSWKMIYSNSSEDVESLVVDTSKGILNGLKECYSKGIKKLVVEAGTYDVINEYKSVYGSDYFTNYNGYSNSTDSFDRGLWLEDIEVIFSPGAKVVCKYTGTNQKVIDEFSPFAVGNNVVIDGLVLDSSNCRYGIHPDYNTGSNMSYMKILNSDLKHYKSSSNEQCIGAGFGIHVNWLIENTIFRCENNNHVFRVHNNISNEACSKLVIKNCYIEGNGYFKFNHYGSSTKESTILISGCSYKNTPVVDYETTSYTNKNMKLISFNNEVRWLRRC